MFFNKGAEAWRGMSANAIGGVVGAQADQGTGMIEGSTGALDERVLYEHATPGTLLDLGMVADGDENIFNVRNPENERRESREIRQLLNTT